MEVTEEQYQFAMQANEQLARDLVASKEYSIYWQIVKTIRALVKDYGMRLTLDMLKFVQFCNKVYVKADWLGGGSDCLRPHTKKHEAVLDFEKVSVTAV